ncbi:cytoplasmic protein-related [Anaeramoeba flamelloides]|uniref:Cytoplasmic protein-related n=1 Tax=Anaeramoeba flamelloides TaxID=1746091 RepID=A0ABQ8Y1G8_9EUKA|nr:cytoplasmic protein-related [Anaeramoeba flamelloides]
MMNIINKKFTYAVIGASNNIQKYGYKIVKDLVQSGFNVVPINPHEQQIQNLQAYQTIKQAEKKIDVVVFVVPPKVTAKILPQLKEQNITKAWMQPGSESEEAIQYCKENEIECMHDACIMIERLK